MAKLSSKARKSLPANDFGDPKNRKYPMENKSHAANAKARVANKSPALKAKVDAKADRVLKAKDGMANVSGKMKANMPVDPKTLGSMVKSLKM